MTVARKIAIAFVLIVALTVALGLASLVSISRMNDYQMATVTDAVPGIEYILRAESMAKDIRGAMFSHIGSVTQDDKNRLEADIVGHQQKFRETLRNYEKTISRQVDRDLFIKIEPAYDRFIESWGPVQQLSRQAKTQEAFDAFGQNSLARFRDFQQAITDEVDQNRNYADECTAGSVAAASSARWWVGGVLAFSIFVGGLAAFGVIRNVNAALRRAAADLARGAAEIGAAATQVSSSSQSLAQGASEQAATLEETSASTEEITSMTRSNADRSTSAANVMAEVAQTFEKANGNVEEMIRSMSEINTSSEKISKIIKVIDEIAFQTNILALNAAVEAARAGEAGMGFAVVADEVRNLAQRSAQAAKDTASMIEESISKSNEGSAKLQQVVEVIRAVTNSASSVKILIDEVNIGCQEQARGIEQIAKAVMQMDSVTQTTAATAEESASASEELTAQAEGLKDIIVILQKLVGGETAGAAGARTVRPAKVA